jgi:hypothetical protein
MLLRLSLAFFGQRVPNARLNPGSTLRDPNHLQDFGAGSDLLASLDLVLHTGGTKGDFLRPARAA